MKRRSRVGRKHFNSPQRKAFGLHGRKERKRKSWTFEHLENRHCFSATPLNLQFVSMSNETPEGQAAIWQREFDWAVLQTLDATAHYLNTTTNAAANNTSILEALPNDPLFPSQWHLLNTGQEVGNPDFQHLFGVAGEDINVVPVWNMGYTGEGVIVAVIDSGVQMNHPDLIGNLHPTLRFNAITGTSNPNPPLFEPSAYHGTAVAGIIGATWNNAGDPILDEDGNPILDVNGNPVREGGGVGVAPNVTLVPIRAIDAFNANFDDQIFRSFQYALANDVDITNSSYGDGTIRTALPLRGDILQVLRDSVLFGRGGLGMINVFSSGNLGGPSFTPGFPSFGNYDSSTYKNFLSRYTIAVAGVDHDGLYINSDGTFTSYPEAGPNVLVAAPTGSNVAQTVAQDEGQGSGIWTTDLIGDFGFNAAPLPNGFDPDRDLLADPNYTSRFNGTSAAAPVVSGVIALMLDANPNLTFRDVQEILLRSARQNAQFELPSSGGIQGFTSTWQTNQIGPFRDPDPWNHFAVNFPAQMILDPLADTTFANFPDSTVFPFLPYNDLGRISGHYEAMPANFTNGAGYTVSQGYGIYGEMIGYGHGVVDAELAVKMALQWHDLGQNLDPFTERTFTTFVVSPIGPFPAAEEMSDDTLGLLVPGGIGGQGGYIDYWNEYFEDPPAPFDPAEPDDWPNHTRGDSYIPWVVPPDEAINAEWVEVKIELAGPAEDLDFIRIMLTSPEGMQSELNHYYADPEFIPTALQISSLPAGLIDPFGDIDTDGGTFVWTFTTNQMFGESTNTAVIIDPVTGEPVLGPGGLPVFRNWELHLENWSNSDYFINGVEVVWHGKPIEGGALDENWQVAAAQRVQGFVGIDNNNDEQFNYTRYTQTVSDLDNDPLTIFTSDVVRVLDTTFQDNNGNGIFDAGDTRNQEPFAENILVEAYRVDPVTGAVDDDPTARFLTGADGNYYFDLDPNFEYEIRITDPLNRIILEDTETPDSAPPGLEYLPHFKESWRITPDWFFAPDRDNPLGVTDNPGEIFVGMHDANGDGISTLSPQPFIDMGDPIPMAVKNINFLLKQDAPAASFDVTGTVYADLNGDGIFNENDAPAPGIFVYQDVNRNGVADAAEQRVETDANGQYTLTIPATAVNSYQIGVIPPSNLWIPTDPGGDGLALVFAGPGSPTQVVNFFLDPPEGGEFPGNGNILGVVFNDLDTDGIRDPGEIGLPGFTVFIDANENGLLDTGDTQATTASNGAFFFSDVEPGLHRIDIHIENEGTDNAAWRLTTPAVGFREVQLGQGATVQGVSFGVENRADADWGDLPDSYSTLASSNGPNHTVVPGFHLGATLDGEVNGIPTTGANGDDVVGNDETGVRIISNGGLLRVGPNTIEVVVHGVGGILNAWMDLNGDGNFDLNEQVIVDADLNPGTRQVTVTLPPNTVGGPMAARFRWGEAGLSFSGPAGIGEVEDYYLPSSVVPVVQLAGDFNLDGRVDQLDHAIWRETYDSTTDLRADASKNGIVDLADFIIWRKNEGTTTGTSTAVSVVAGPLESFSTMPIFGSTSALRQAGLLKTTGVPLPVGNLGVSGSSSNSSDSLLLVGMNGIGGSSRPTFSPGSREQLVAGSSVANAGLLVLDQAWGDYDNDDESDDDWTLNWSDDKDSLDDLTLAEVFADDAQIWQAL
ncbi:MAG TPA: S8 family serine peptidase [Lacipirellulaceae bacterium]|nr:S8 family serine peptidase [Lacipirellulaceae bacterium]